MSQRISFRVHGTVQGVFFRKFAQHRAEALGVTGWVRNEADGSVAGEAQGSADAIDKLVADLRQGPRHAVVEGLDRDSIAPKGKDEERGFATRG